MPFYHRLRFSEGPFCQRCQVVRLLGSGASVAGIAAQMFVQINLQADWSCLASGLVLHWEGPGPATGIQNTEPQNSSTKNLTLTPQAPSHLSFFQRSWGRGLGSSFLSFAFFGVRGFGSVYLARAVWGLVFVLVCISGFGVLGVCVWPGVSQVLPLLRQGMIQT